MSLANKSGDHNPVVVCPRVSPVTKQSFRDEVDVNQILDKYARTGVLPVNGRAPMFGDFSSLPSFLDAQILVRKAEDGFLKLSPDVRARFDNSPAKLLAFLDDPQNREEAVKLGILEAKEPVKAEVPKAGSDAPSAKPGAQAAGA